ncbi:ParD-like family protein [Comamonas composti]|uniref:ParD-like family protein n=1 Tax=Comamonas composti TaxID=408558 RepID=UPI000421FE5F|nr:ParD-like family protein [Comamonas composti]
MGIVKISDDLHDQIRLSSTALSRSINAQAEHWLRVGRLAELHPQLDYAGICALLHERADRQAGKKTMPALGAAAAKGLQ